MKVISKIQKNIKETLVCVIKSVSNRLEHTNVGKPGSAQREDYMITPWSKPTQKSGNTRSDYTSLIIASLRFTSSCYLSTFTSKQPGLPMRKRKAFFLGKCRLQPRASNKYLLLSFGLTLLSKFWGSFFVFEIQRQAGRHLQFKNLQHALEKSQGCL